MPVNPTPVITDRLTLTLTPANPEPHLEGYTAQERAELAQIRAVTRKARR